MLQHDDGAFAILAIEVLLKLTCSAPYSLRASDGVTTYCSPRYDKSKNPTAGLVEVNGRAVKASAEQLGRIIAFQRYDVSLSVTARELSAHNWESFV
jgi:hypothetical protein